MAAPRRVDPAALPAVDDAVKTRAMDEAPVGIVLTDPTLPDNPIVYCNDAFERITGYPRSEVLGRNCRFLQGPDTDSDAVATLARGIEDEATVSAELRNYRRSGEEFWNQVKIAPLRDDDGAVTHFVGFQMDVTERTRAQRALERERETLERVLERVNGLLGDVTAVVVTAATREEIERRVCERITSGTPYEVAWIGDRDVTGDIDAHAWNPGARAPETGELDGTHPAVRALETGELQVVTGADARASASTDAMGVAAVPLAYRETVYGVLVVESGTAAAVDDREIVVLEALGRAVATALNARESSRLLAADELVEVALEVRDDALFVVALSATLECTIEYRGAVVREGTPLLFFSTDTDPDAVRRAAVDLSDVAAASVVGTRGDGGLLEVELAPSSVVSELAERGARTRAITATDGVGRVDFELSADADARSVVEQFRERYPDSELLRFREATRPPTTEREFVAALQDSLTDRQRTALRKAYVAGYFAPARRITGEELAASMGVSRATFHQHLRAAERKLLDALFDR